MNIQAQETYKYFYAPGQQGHDVKIERVCMGTAYCTSESVGEMSFSMMFDAETGEGKGQYAGTYLEEYAEGEVYTETFEVTYKHTGPYLDHMVTIKVRKDEEILLEAEKAMKAENQYFNDHNGYIKSSVTYRMI